MNTKDEITLDRDNLLLLVWLMSARSGDRHIKDTV